MNDFLRVFAFVRKLKDRQSKLSEEKDQHERLLSNLQDFSRARTDEHERNFYGGDDE